MFAVTLANIPLKSLTLRKQNFIYVEKFRACKIMLYSVRQHYHFII